MANATAAAAIALERNLSTDIDPTLSQLLAIAQPIDPETSPDWLTALRDGGTQRVEAGSFPTRRDEDWRVTDLSLLKKASFQPAQSTALRAADIEAFRLSECDQSRLVFVNGHYAADHSQVSGLPSGITVGNLAQLSSKQQTALGQYAAQQSADLDVFAALNDAACNDIAVVWVAKNTMVEQPIQLLFLEDANAEAAAMQSRCLVILESGSQLSLIEQYGAIATGGNNQNISYFNNALTEVWVAPNARLNHVRLQQETVTAAHIGNTVIAQAQDSFYQLTEVNFGAQLSRHSLTLRQKGPNTETILKGLTMVGDTQLGDTHTAVYLQHPQGQVDQLHKCIVDGSARSVFNGKVDVPQAAQQTNAAQLNRNLLLSPKAKVDTKPELQITADDVKCAHGATVSQLEADEIFYLRSRGLSEDNARYLLIDAFAAEILDSLAIASLRQSLTDALVCRTAH